MKRLWLAMVGIALAGVACGNGGGSGSGAGASTMGSGAGDTGGGDTGGFGGGFGGQGGGVESTTVTTGPGSPPTSATITGTIDMNPDPFAQESDNTVIVVYTGAVNHYTVSPAVGDQLVLSGASSHTLESPSQGGCSSEPDISLGIDNATISFTGQDNLPATDCVDLATAIKNNGIQVHYKDVPFANGGSIPDVEVTFTP